MSTKPLVSLTLALALLAMTACASKQAGPADDQAMHSGPQTHHAETSSHYYDFNDVLIPREMELQPKLSFVFEGPSVKAGVLVFKGRVDPVSLTNFFISNMIKDGWQLSSSFKYRRTILVFTKPDRDCIINIIDDRFTTSMEVWVAPREPGSTPLATSPSERTLVQ